MVWEGGAQRVPILHSWQRGASKHNCLRALAELTDLSRFAPRVPRDTSIIELASCESPGMTLPTRDRQ